MRLLELALSNDDRVAVEALKLLVPMAGEGAGGIDPVLDALPTAHMEEVLERAEQFIRQPGGESSSSPREAVPRAEVFSALRTTDHANVSGSEAPSHYYGRAGDAGSGDDHTPDR